MSKVTKMSLVYFVNQVGDKVGTKGVMSEKAAKAYVRMYNSIPLRCKACTSPAIDSDLLAHVHILFSVNLCGT